MLKTSLLLSAGLALGAIAMPSQAATVTIGSGGAAGDVSTDVPVSSWIRGDNNGGGGEAVLFVGGIDANAFNGVLAFDLSGLNVADTITGASISLFRGNAADATGIFSSNTGSVNSDVSVNIAQITQPVTNAATYLTYDGTNAWTTAGGDAGAVLASATANLDDALVGEGETIFTSAALAAAIQTAVSNGDASIAFLITAPDVIGAGNGRNFFVFDGSDASAVPGNSSSLIGPSLELDGTFVPEPGSLALLGLGGLLLARRRRG